MSIQIKAALMLTACVIAWIGYNTYDRATSPAFVPDQSITNNAAYKKIVLAGGCFWCTESEFNHVDGVKSAISGYADAGTPSPSYGDVGSGKVVAREAVEVIYDQTIISIQDILTLYFKHIDPTDTGGQFADRGHQYTTAIYYTESDQQATANALVDKIQASKKFTVPVATEVLPFVNFYPAEEYHQDYKDKNPVRYAAYREASGRNSFVRSNWADTSVGVAEIFGTTTHINSHTMNDNTHNTQSISGATSSAPAWMRFTQAEKEAKLKTLTDLQVKVTQKEGTERPFANEYNDNKEKGIYVDIVSGEPLFYSSDKYDSGTGWPSFVKPVKNDAITLHVEDGIFSSRTEVRSKVADSHLGHVFPDGPADRGGKRYCMNSAAMRFVALADMEKEGYGEYVGMVR